MSDTHLRHYLDNAVKNFRQLKSQADRAMAQINDDAFFATLDGEANSIAHLVKHMAGNSRSRWTDFLTSDGEKPDRYRDQEFIMDAGATRSQILEQWEAGWQLMFNTLEPLEPSDFDTQVVIRSEPHTIIQAINRQLTHYGYHIGQIVLLAKHHAGPDWKTLSVARGQSEAFNKKMFARNK